MQPGNPLSGMVDARRWMIPAIGLPGYTFTRSVPGFRRVILATMMETS
jgi:hypothetical protein